MNSRPHPLLRLADLLDAFSEYTGRTVAWLTLAMVVITFSIVVLRYAFNLGWIAMQESVTFLHATVFLLGAAYTLRHDGHVRVDIFYREMSPRARAAINLLGTLVFLIPVCAFVFWTSREYVTDSWSLKEGSREAGGLPGVFLLKTLIPIMACLVIVQGFAQVLHAVLVLSGIEPGKQTPVDTEI